mmetsp:Transcript_17790/g.53609  ORF Transcript_17790/g.53609 Transcript_17790/m.53609 type:complete len:93 (+) Transcript_17790:170-448(+)
MDYDKQLAAVEAFVLADDRVAALHSEFAPKSDSALFLTGLMALQRGDTAAAREAVDAMSYANLPAVGGRRAELETLVLVREVGEAEGNAKQA